MTTVVTSGYFDPLTKGHIEYLKKAKGLGDYLIVLIDSNQKTVNKKGYYFMDAVERQIIMSELSCVDKVMIINEPVSKVLESINPDIFAKGGDRNLSNLPKDELDICNKMDIQIICGLGDKISSSSDLVERCNRLS